jgi:amino acid transporter
VSATFILLVTYVLVSVSLQAFAGSGTTGIGLRNPANANNTLSVLGGPILGTGLTVWLLLAICSSASGAVLTYVAPTARTILSMAVYRALPRPFAMVHRTYQTPWLGTVVIGVGGFVIYAAMMLFSHNSLPDMVSSLALVTTFYYALTAYACMWTFRRTWRKSVVKFWFPLLGAVAMTGAFIGMAAESYSPTYGKTHFGPVGGVFIMGIGLLVLGIPVALLYAKGEPLKAFFKAHFTLDTFNAFFTTLKAFFTLDTFNAIFTTLKAFFTLETLNAIFTTLKAFFTLERLKACLWNLKAFFTGDTVSAFFRREILNDKTEITVKHAD